MYALELTFSCAKTNFDKLEKHSPQGGSMVDWPTHVAPPLWRCVLKISLKTSFSGQFLAALKPPPLYARHYLNTAMSESSYRCSTPPRCATPYWRSCFRSRGAVDLERHTAWHPLRTVRRRFSRSARDLTFHKPNCPRLRFDFISFLILHAL